MKRPAYLHLLIGALLCAWQILTCPPASAQSGAGAEAALDLDCQGCWPSQTSVRLLPGRKVALSGPPGTAPIKGKLLQGGDTITLQSGTHIRQVAAQDVRMVSATRPYLWLKLLIMHVLYLPYLLLAGILLGLSASPLALVIALLATPYVLAWIGVLARLYKNYRIGPWKIRRPLD
jgi:hypothetical protein